MTVFFPTEMPPAKADRDFSAAQRYGTLDFIVPNGQAPSFMPAQALARLRAILLPNFNPAQDFVSYGGGDPLGLLLMGAVLRETGIKEFRYLRTDRERGTGGRVPGSVFYTPVHIVLE